MYILTADMLAGLEVLGQCPCHVHAHVVGHRGGDDLEDVGRGEGVDFRAHHWVYRQDVNQLDFFVVVGACI